MTNSTVYLLVYKNTNCPNKETPRDMTSGSTFRRLYQSRDVHKKLFFKSQQRRKNILVRCKSKDLILIFRI